MLINLYIRSNHGTTFILPDQFEDDLSEIVFQKNENLDKILEQKGQFLCTVNLSTNLIENIIHRKEPDYYISSKDREKIKLDNLNKIRQLENNLQVPLKPNTIFTTDINWDLACIGLEQGLYPLFIGPTGCGKSEFSYALAEATQREIFPINCGSIFKPKQTLVGSTGAKDGTTFLIDSEFLKAFTSEKPTLIYLDELSRIPGPAANYMMTILDRRQSYVYIEDLGKRVYKGKDVVFVASGNFGFEYTDTRNQDGAFLNRFIKILVDYLPENEEVNCILQAVPKAKSKEKDVRQLVKKANLCRKQYEELRCTVSTRNLIDFTKYLAAGFSLNSIIDNLFINLFINGTTDSRDQVKTIIQATM